jgi:CheY-like chemotaxis protein
LPDVDGIRLVEQLKSQPRYEHLPVVVYTNRDLSLKEREHLKKYAASIIVKGAVQSTEQLLKDTALFLHRVEKDLSQQPSPAPLPPAAEPPAPRTEEAAQLADVSLAGRKVLVVDDDARNIFALTSVLESHELQVLYAEDGRAGIKLLHENPDIDVVLMDVMMPEMDGYETMQAIRSEPRYRDLPIIAVTAKALKEDRDKCLRAGASDYLPKPVDTDRLITLMKHWLRSRGAVKA